jgi:hypothetical protein
MQDDLFWDESNSEKNNEPKKMKLIEKKIYFLLLLKIKVIYMKNKLL